MDGYGLTQTAWQQCTVLPTYNDDFILLDGLPLQTSGKHSLVDISIMTSTGCKYLLQSPGHRGSRSGVGSDPLWWGRSWCRTDRYYIAVTKRYFTSNFVHSVKSWSIVNMTKKQLLKFSILKCDWTQHREPVHSPPHSSGAPSPRNELVGSYCYQSNLKTQTHSVTSRRRMAPLQIHTHSHRAQLHWN